MTAALIGKYKKWAIAAGYDAQKLARFRRISVRQLQREFKQLLRRTPQDWLNEQRAVVARDMLIAGRSVKQIAIDLGFKQSSHFCRHFKNYNHITPSQYASANLISGDVANG